MDGGSSTATVVDFFGTQNVEIWHVFVEKRLDGKYRMRWCVAAAGRRPGK